MTQPNEWAVVAGATGSIGSQIVERLLASGCQIDAPDADGMSPLMHVSRAGKDEVVQRFLHAGAQVHPDADHGPSALQEAIMGRHVSTVALLLAAPGSRVDYPCRKPGWTPLMTAAHIGEAEIATLLLNHGADVDQTDVDGRTAARDLAAGDRGFVRAVVAAELLYGRTGRRRCCAAFRRVCADRTSGTAFHDLANRNG